MIDVCNPKELRELLDRYGLAPKKGYGQNFLIQPNVPQRIAEESRAFAPLDKPAGVLEIGPGVGALTRYLAEYYDKVTAVEIDTGLIPLLGELFGETDNVTVVHKDFMELDLPTFLEDQFGDILASGGTVSVCANLPYYITTPVLMRILESWPASKPVPLSGITVMVQLEVARRICADPGDKDDYGALSAAIGLHGDTEKLFDVSPGCFFPAPKVSSAVCAILPHGGVRQVYPGAPTDDEGCDKFGTKVSDVIGLAFGQRRKTLVNSLSARYPKDATAAALEEMGLRPDVRGEKLTTSEFCTLTGLLEKL